MTAKLGALVARAAQALGATLDEERRAQVVTWLERLQEWNARIDLTAARSEEELVDLTLADALTLAPRFDGCSGVVDVGTGAGAPGLAIALVRPDLRVTLVEPSAKRTSFLRTVIGEIGRTDIAIERARGDAVGQFRWDTAVSRATLSPAEWLGLGTKLVAPGGRVWVLLAKEDAPKHDRAAIVDDLTYEWPLTRARRRAVEYRIA
jgi:16S rRNA (guanine527-N7)-methyltransferase